MTAIQSTVTEVFVVDRAHREKIKNNSKDNTATGASVHDVELEKKSSWLKSVFMVSKVYTGRPSSPTRSRSSLAENPKVQRAVFLCSWAVWCSALDAVEIKLALAGVARSPLLDEISQIYCRK